VLVPVGLFAALESSDRGFGGTIRGSVEALTSPTSHTPGGPSRLTTASSSRARYWDEASQVFGEDSFKGTGAGTFGVARLKFRDGPLVSNHAHGFVVQTMADLGVLGLIAIGLLALAWLVAAARAVGLLPPGAERRWDGERVALVALALAALVFALHSAIDWTWFVPGPTLMAVAAAGAVAGRSFLASRRPEESDAALGRVPRYVLAGAAAVVALACAWAVWQPARSEAETDHALDLLAARRLPAAAHAAEHASEIDPLSPNPLLAAASIAAARGDTNGALARLQRAVRRFPGEPQVWLRLAEYQLDALAKPADAMATIRGALRIDPESRAVQQLYLEAKRRLEPAPLTTPTPPPTPATPPSGGAKPPATTPTPTTPGPTPGKPVVPAPPNKTG
jgi:hypothetical protein